MAGMPDDGPVYDIYIVADVEGLKADYADLKEKWRGAVRENAALCAELDRHRRGDVRREQVPCQAQERV